MPDLFVVVVIVGIERNEAHAAVVEAPSEDLALCALLQTETTLWMFK